MPQILEAVAALVDVRDKDDLEVMLARVLFEFVEPSRLSFWSVVEDENATLVRERVRLFPSALAEGFDNQTGSPLREVWTRRGVAGDPTRGLFASGVANAERCLAYPVFSGSTVVGWVEIERASALSDEQQRLVRLVIRIYRSHLGILEDTDTDELTGLANRKPFDRIYRRLAEHAAASARRADADPRRSHAASRAELAIVDIDFFKRVNDRFGHPYGDEVLVLLSRLMRDSFRESDRLYRFGGEEFVILMQGATPTDAERALDRFRGRVESYPFPQVGSVTVSVGVSTIRPGEAASDAIGRADEALYVAKRNGRNQVRRYETLVAEGWLQPKRPVEHAIELF